MTPRRYEPSKKDHASIFTSIAGGVFISAYYINEVSSLSTATVGSLLSVIAIMLTSMTLLTWAFKRKLTEDHEPVACILLTLFALTFTQGVGYSFLSYMTGETANLLKALFVIAITSWIMIHKETRHYSQLR